MPFSIENGVSRHGTAQSLTRKLSVKKLLQENTPSFFPLLAADPAGAAGITQWWVRRRDHCPQPDQPGHHSGRVISDT
jgi:hypothetical protein